MKNKPEIVNSVELAGYLVMSPRQVYVLAERGLVVKSGRGFDLAASCRRYTGHLRRVVEIGKLFPRLTNAEVETLSDHVTAEILKATGGG